MNKVYTIIGIILVIIILFFNVTTTASTDSYTIDSYNIDIKINENNTYDISETIKVNFSVPSHGINRTIPLKNTVTTSDGTTIDNNVQISNLKINDKYIVTREYEVYKIKTGSSFTKLTGEKTYKINYTYNVGQDSSIDYDEVYFNIIGNEWDTTIKNITFSITMPKGFNESNLSFSTKKVDSLDSSQITYNVVENVISGTYNDVLYPQDSLTVRLELPEGYFVNAGYKIDSKTRLLLLISTSCLIISVCIWYLFGKNDKIAETIEFYPPNGFNSLEVGFLYKGEATIQDVTSLLIYLANKGYIKIKETPFCDLRDFQIIKLKDYDGTNDAEREFLDGLFSHSSSTASIENIDMPVITKFDLYNKFYKTANKILKETNSRANKKKIFAPGTFFKSILISLILIISFGAFEIYALKCIDFHLAVVLIMLLFFIFAKMSTSIKQDNIKISDIFHSSTLILLAIVTIIITTLVDFSVALSALWSIICICIINFCCETMLKRNKYGNEMLGKIRGFKNYLNTVEKEQLETMARQDPTYFYNVLPFVYALGISDKLIENSKTISIQAPEWYDSPSGFSVNKFNLFINHTMNSIVASSRSNKMFFD